jgi:5-methyltetrahydrofolate corrinoid/iron sulfur protein methyltransferase
MKLIGENLNIVSKTYGPALKERNAGPLRELAIAQTKAGMDFIDINIGPARKEGDKFMEWVVKTVQEVTDLPLSLDTTNPLAMEAGLKAHRGKALLNSISLERMAEELPLAVKYDCDFVG